MNKSTLIYLLLLSANFCLAESFVTKQNKESISLSGTVLRTDRLPESSTNEEGINMQLDTQNGVFNIHIGPMWWTQLKGAAPSIGDPVSVVGFRVSFDKKPTIVAKEITINGKVFKVWEKTDRAITNEKTSNAKN